MTIFDMNTASDRAFKMDVHDAMNAIDEQLGGTGKLGHAKRRERGIRIVGKKKEK